jgi:tetratricopeptide (TPR) repeat protein
LLVVGLLLVVAAVTAGFVIMRWPQQNDAERLWILAQAYYNSGGYDKSTETLTKLLTLNPNPYDVEAKALLEMAKRLGDIKRLYGNATVLKAQEQWAEAAQELRAFYDLCQRLGNSIPDPDLRRACQDAVGELPGIERKAQLASLYVEGKALYDRQEWARAAEAFQKLQATDPDYKRDEVNGYLYVTYLSHGERVIEVAGNAADQVELAISLFQHALQIRPNDPRPGDELNMARVYLQALNSFHASNWPLLRTQAENIYQKLPNYAGGRIAGLLCTAYLRLGDGAYEQGDREATLAFYRQVLQVQGCDHTEAEVKEHKVFVELNPLTPTPTPTATTLRVPSPTDTLPPFGTPPPTHTPRPSNTATLYFYPTDTPFTPPTNTPFTPPTNTPFTPPTNTPFTPPTNTPTRLPTSTTAPTFTPVPPTFTAVPPTFTLPPPTFTPAPPTSTPVPPPTNTPVPPPTNTPVPLPTRG